MGIFGKRTKNKKFEYIPRFYDPAKEALQERLKNYEDSDVNKPELMKQRIKSGFKYRGKRTDSDFRKKQVKRSNVILLSVLIVLIFLSYIFIADYLPRIIEVFDKGNTN